MRGTITLLLMFVPVVAFGQITGITGSSDTTMNRGETKTLDLDINAGSAGFTRELNFFINASAGLSLGTLTVTPPAGTSINCSAETRDGKDAITCNGGVVSLPANSKVHASLPFTLKTEAYSLSEQVVLQLVGTALSGAAVKTFNIFVSDPRPHIITDQKTYVIVKAPHSEAGVSIPLTNDGNANGVATISAPSFVGITSNFIGVPAGTTRYLGVYSMPDTQPVGTYNGFIVINRLPDQPINLPIRLIVSNNPLLQPVPKTSTTRLSVQASSTSGSGLVRPEAASFTTTLTITNSGPGDVVGAFESDAAWAVPPPNLVTIAPNDTKSFDISVDSTMLPFPNDTGSRSSTVTLTYLLPVPTGSSRLRPLDNTSPPPATGSISVSLVYTKPPTATGAAPPSLDKKCPTCFGDTALFIPAVGHVEGAGAGGGTLVSDLTVFPKVGFGGLGTSEKRSISNVDIYYTPLAQAAASASKKITINALAPPSSVLFGDIASTVFGSAQLGTLQIRAPNFTIDELLGLHAHVLNSTGAVGTGASLPVLNSDLAATGTGKVFLPGLRKDSGGHTDIYIQESLGVDNTAAVDFYDASGKSIGSTTAALTAFSAMQLSQQSVPSGTVSAVVSPGSGNGGVHAYAIVVDDTTKDKSVVTDWRRIYSYLTDYVVNAPILVPIVGATKGANNTYFKTDLVMMNISTTPATGTLRYYNQRGATIDKPISISPLETKVYSDVTTSLFGVSTDNIGYLIFTPANQSNVLITARIANGGYATEVPGMLTNTSNYTNGGRPARLSGVDDAGYDKLAASQVGSTRSNFALIELAGKSATVRVTVYVRSNTDKTSTIAGASKTYDLAPNQMLMGPISNVLGGDRNALGDLHNVTVEFQVVGGAGRVMPFMTSVDNSTGDSIVRIP